MAAGLTEGAHREYPQTGLGYSTGARFTEGSVVKHAYMEYYAHRQNSRNVKFAISERYVGSAPKRFKEVSDKEDAPLYSKPPDTEVTEHA